MYALFSTDIYIYIHTSLNHIAKLVHIGLTGQGLMGGEDVRGCWWGPVFGGGLGVVLETKIDQIISGLWTHPEIIWGVFGAWGSWGGLGEGLGGLGRSWSKYKIIRCNQ